MKHTIDTPKYLQEIETTQPWQQPKLDSTTGNGTLGGSSFAVSVSNTYSGAAWHLFDDDTSTKWDGGSRPSYFIFYNPTPICVTNIQTYSNTAAWTDTKATISASNDNVTWEDLATITLAQTNTQNWSLLSNTNYYKYYKYTSISGGVSSNSFSEVYITATEHVTIHAGLVPQPHSVNTPKYLKKVVVETPWEQPILSANGTMGGNSFAVEASSQSSSTEQAYYAFDGLKNSRYSASANSATFYWIAWYNPEPIRISSLSIYNANYSGATGPTGGTVQGSNDGSTWVDIKTFTNSTTAINQTWTISVNSNTSYKYHRIYVPSSNFTGSVARARFGEITITAIDYSETWGAGTSSDYTMVIPQKHTVNVPKYLKLVTVETAWTQPILSSAGTMGGSSFAVSDNGHYSSNAFWKCFDGNHSSSNYGYFRAGQGPAKSCTVIMYNPEPIKIQSIKSYNVVVSAAMNFGTGTIYGSNDGTNYTQINIYSNLQATGSTKNDYVTIPVNSTSFYNYYKISNTDTPSNIGGVIVGSGEFEITATEYIETWQAGTPQDYDIIM